MSGSQHDVWAVGAGYEFYVGRWSRLVAPEFLKWLAVPIERNWLDVGGGTGALTQTSGVKSIRFSMSVFLPANSWESFLDRHTLPSFAHWNIGVLQLAAERQLRTRPVPAGFGNPLKSLP